MATMIYLNVALNLVLAVGMHLKTPMISALSPGLRESMRSPCNATSMLLGRTPAGADSGNSCISTIY